jgi:hypothetical protein
LCHPKTPRPSRKASVVTQKPDAANPFHILRPNLIERNYEVIHDFPSPFPTPGWGSFHVKSRKIMLSNESKKQAVEQRSMMCMIYRIKVKGQLDPKLSEWFGNFAISHTPDGDTLLTGIVIDQAALHGVLARCRDLGVTLISINPLNAREGSMSKVIVNASDVIDARPEQIYAILSDYRVGHAAILPKPYFKEMIVEQGGQGEGTIIRLKMNVFGQEYTYHQIVTEPEPGRLLVETDMNTGQFSSFTLEPLNGGAQTRVTIHSEFPGKPGIAGWMEKLMQPPITRHIFKKELRNLAEYVRSKAVLASAT